VANRTGYLISFTGGGGFDVLTTELVFDELDYAPVSTSTVNYPTTFGNVDGATYFVGGYYYFVPDDPLPAAPSETASAIDEDLPIFGFWGSETIIAPDGDGYVIYSGSDTSGFSTGWDTIYGGSGDDHIFYGDGDDIVYAGDGDDIIGGADTNSSGTNTLDGGAGNDQVIGGSGDDTIYGDTGDDFLVGGAGADTLFGGEGSDLFAITDDHERTDVVGGETGSDYDAVAFANFISSSPVVVTFTADEAGQYSFTETAGFGTFTEIEAFYGTGNDDQLNASLSSVRQELFGNGGDDYVQGGSAGDVLYGGDGNDTIIGEGYVASGSNMIVNGSFEDTTGMTATGYGYMGVGAAPGWTEANGYAVDFHSDGRNGIVATDGAHWLDTEGGIGENLRIGQDVAGVTDGATYLVRLDIKDFSTPDDDTALDNQVHVVWNGEVIAKINPPDSAWDTFEFVVVGGSGDGSNRLEFIGSGAADAAGASIDNVQMYEAVPTSDGDDFLVGEAGDDTIAGGDGDDWIIGNSGANMLSGGDGDDTFEVVTADGGTDTIIGGEGGEVQGDALRFTGSDAATVTFTTLESGTYSAGGASGSFSEIERFEGTGEEDTLNLTGVAGPLTITFDGDTSGSISDGTSTIFFNGFEEILASDQDDVIDASVTTTGVTLHGEGGNDQVTGGSGDDALSGGGGDDVLAAGGGNDTITGGAGEDTYVFEDGDGSNVITDFDMADDDLDGFTNDQLDLSGLTDADGETVNTWDMVVSDDGSGNSVLTFNDGTTVTLQGVAPATLDGSTYYSMGVPCFAAGTRIATPEGPRRVETLVEGDLVSTLDGEDLPIIWAGQSRLDRGVLDRRPDLAPVKIKPGALGNDRTLTVSPLHRIALSDDAGQPAGFVPARWLAEDSDGRFRVAKGMREVVYVHLMLPKHAVISGDNAPSESFYPGPEALIAMGREARNALFTRLPALAVIATDADAERIYGPLALPELPRDRMLPFLLERSVA